MKHDNEYAQMGMAALLPGMQYMKELVDAFMQEQIEDLRLRLAAAQGMDSALAAKPRRGRPPKAAAVPQQKENRGGWSADPEERKREMHRRLLLAGRKNGAGGARWAKMTGRERAEWKSKQASKKKAVPVVHLEGGQKVNGRAVA